MEHTYGCWKRRGEHHSKIEKSNHVSKVVFDKIFLQFQNILDCLFENYNNAAVRLFPVVEQVICFLPNNQKKIDKMQNYYEQSETEFNDLVRLIQTNRFILDSDMIELLQRFEKIMKELLIWYKDKIRDIGATIKNITGEKELELVKKAESTLALYDQISDCFKKYIDKLQIID